jgi:hypothetical protein
MNTIKNELVKAERVTEGDAHYFFGYYDTPGWSASGRLHLCHKVIFCDRLPRPEDRAVLGYINLVDRSFHPVAETTAWNFQQGSMLQWHPQSPEDTIIYNAREGGQYKGVVQNIHSGSMIRLEQPVANVKQHGIIRFS